jgi:hypothetical protein
MLDLVVHVTCEGVARLPDGLRVTKPQLVDPVYDAERAEVRGRFAPPPLPPGQRSIFVTVKAPGYAYGEVVAALPRLGTRVQAEVDLVPTRRVEIGVTGPRWAAQALELLKQHTEVRRKVGNTWTDVPGTTYWLPAAAGRGIILNTQQILYDLRPGRYRLQLEGTPFVMREFEVARDDLALRVDLASAGLQQIVLRAPPEIELESARLVTDSYSIAPYSHDTGEARFSVILPGDREVVLEPRHPFTHPGEPLRLVEAGDDLVVDLRPRTLVRFELPAGEKGVPEFLLDREGHAVGGGNALPFGNGYAFVVEPGSYRLRIRVAKKPRFEREIDVPEGGLDLGLIESR